MHEGVQRLLTDRYFWRWNIDGKEIVETPQMVFLRVAKKMASAFLNILNKSDMIGTGESKDKIEKLIDLATGFYNIMNSGDFMPSSPQLFNALRGIDETQDNFNLIYKPIKDTTFAEWKTLNAFKNPIAAYGSCYAMGRVGDSIEEIYDSLKEQAVIFKAAGGYGASFSNLRSEGTSVKTTRGQSCGPVEFMELFNMNTKKIALSGQLKRGANMFSLSVSHPDIETFIDKKEEFIIDEEDGMLRSKHLEHANLSVEVSDEFIDAVKNDLDWELIDPHTKEVKKVVKAKNLYKKIIDSAYKSGEPGILMLSTINKYNPIRDLEPITSVNPCVTGDTLVPTTEGLIRADSLKKGMFTWNPIKNKMEEITAVYNNGVKDIYEITLENGMKLKATSDHKLKTTYDTTKGELIRVSNLKVGYEVHTIVYVTFNAPDGLIVEPFTGLNPATEMMFKIKSIEKIGQDVVYDITVPDDFMWVTNGFISLDCSEYLGFSNTVCNLGSINLYNFVDYKTKTLDTKRLDSVISLAVTYLNLALMANSLPTEKLTKRSMELRPIGLGFMGLGSTLARLGYRYGSKESLDFTKDFVQDFMYYVIKASHHFSVLSDTRFKHYEYSDYAKGEFVFKNEKHKDKISKLLKMGITNSRLSAIAPNGSISKLVVAAMKTPASSVSGGLEPIFSPIYTRRVNPDTPQEYIINEMDVAVYDILKERGYTDEQITEFANDEEAIEKLSEEIGTVKTISVEDHLNIFQIVTEAIDMQASKTVNVPATYTKEDLYNLYLDAYDRGAKGLTVYVDGSREGILNHVKHSKQPEFILDLNLTKQGKILPKERPTIINSLKKTVKFSEEGKDVVSVVNIEVGFDDNNSPFEVFIRSTTTTKEYTELFNAMGRLISLALRSNADMDTILKQTRKIKDWKNNYSNMAMIIASTISELVEIGKSKSKKKRTETIKEINKHKFMATAKGYLVDTTTGEKYCPVCYAKEGEGLQIGSGCLNCDVCGWGGCGG